VQHNAHKGNCQKFNALIYSWFGGPEHMRLFSSRVPLRHVLEKRPEAVSKALEWNVVSEIQIAENIF
jgi:hypothetical protein